MGRHIPIVDETLRGAGELRPLGPTFVSEAEAAFSIEKPWQSHGVGTALLSRTLLAARNRGFKLLHMACLADNRRMQQLALVEAFAARKRAERTVDFADQMADIQRLLR